MNDMKTARLALPLLQPGQAQKEIFHNEALIRLDVATQGAAIAAGANVPPENPGDGQCWILGDATVGAWAGYAAQIAAWTAGGWRFVEPCEGMRIWVAEDRAFALFSQGGWTFGESHGRVLVDGVQVIGARGAPIAEPAGGETVDAQARATIASILEALRTHGLVGTL